MSSSTPNKGYILQTTGENSNTWGTELNNNFINVADLNLGGRYTPSVAGSSNVTVSSANAQNIRHRLTGLLTGNIDYILPNAGGFYIITNATTGSFSVTVKPSGGTGVVVPQNSTMTLFMNPTTAAAETIIDTFSGSLTASAFIPNGSSVPTNGLFLPVTNVVGYATNSVRRGVIDANGRVVVGQSDAAVTGVVPSTPATPYLQVLGTDADTAGILGARYSANALPPRWVLTKSRSGTLGTHSIVSASDQCGAILFAASDGSQFVGAAQIRVEVDGTPGSNDMPGRLILATTADGASSTTDRLTINSAGTATFSGAINEAAPVTIASATTTDIGAAASNNVTISGTTTITGLGTVASGVNRLVTFSGILTLTYNGTSLILPTSANITTAAGDTAHFTSLGSGNWRCADYTRANGQSLAGSYSGANNLAQFQHTTTGTTSGGTFTSGSFATRTLNTTSINNISGASLGSNQITLPAGSYYVEIQAVASGVNSHMARLRNVTDSADVAFSNYGRAQTSSNDNNLVVGQNYFTIATSKVFELQHRCETTRATAGYGEAVTDFSTNNIWAQVIIRKEA